MGHTPVTSRVVFCIFSLFFAISVALGTPFGGEEAQTGEPPKDERTDPVGKRQGEAKTAEKKTVPVDPFPAARVNGVTISRPELDKSYNSFIQQRGMDTQMITDPDRYRQVQLEVLEGLISMELLWQEAGRKDLVASDAAVSEALSAAKGRFPSEEEFNLRLAQSGSTPEEYSEFLRRQLSVRELVLKDISVGIEVSNEEVHGYYEANPGQFVSPEQVRARHILVKLAPGADELEREKAKKKIEAIHEEAKGGADFPGLAKEHSEGPTGPEGGDLGFFSRDQMVKPFSDAAFSLEPGEISGVVQTRYGYHVIRVEEKRASRTIEEGEVREQVRQFLHQGKVQDAVRARVETLRREGEVEVLIGK